MTAALGETTEDSFRLAIYNYSQAIADEADGLCTAGRLKGCHDELIRHYRALSERLARVEAEERERCARVCEEYADSLGGAIDATVCAAAIRAGHNSAAPLTRDAGPAPFAGRTTLRD